MKNYSRILTIQDISCVGQCSLTVALPILSAFGIETCILPSAILSTHTAGFKGFTCKDFTEEFEKIISHWEKERIDFSTFYTGYLVNEKQIDLIKKIFMKFSQKNSVKIINAVMGDHGKLYPGFNTKFVEAIKSLCLEADIIILNLTEACFLTNFEYKQIYTENYILELVKKLDKLGSEIIVITGISYTKDTTGVLVLEKGNLKYYKHRRLEKSYHGTGDIYSSIFVGLYMNGIKAYEAACISADFIVDCIEYTMKEPSHWYGVKFEPLLADFITRIKKKNNIQ